jgi:hypothetical protein
MATWFGGGYIALIALAGLLASSINETLGRVLIASMLTIVVLGGACLAEARVEFEWKATEIARKVANADVALGGTVPPGQSGWPARAEWMWRLARLFLVLGGIFAVAVGWWWASAAQAASSLH